MIKLLNTTFSGILTRLATLACIVSASAFAQFSVTTTQYAQTAFIRNTNGYDFVPSVMFDGKYRMWWCGSRPNYPGDYIFYAEASNINGPWTSPGSNVPNSFLPVLAPLRDGKFDSEHTCDPTVVRSGGTYFMYYGGTGYNSPATATTAIGVASSTDGINWTRLNNGDPILMTHPSRHALGTNRPYGTGQPSVVVMNGWFYMIHTDHLGLASNPGNGAGQYVLRSMDPLFGIGVQAMTGGGWRAIADRQPGTAESQFRYESRTSYSTIEAFSVDWTYSDMMGGFVVAHHHGGNETYLDVWNNLDWGNQKVSPVPLWVPGQSADGPGIVRRPDGHAMASTVCGETPVDLIRPAGGVDVFTSQMTATKAVLNMAQTCNGATWSGVFNTWKVATPGLPLMVVVNGLRLQVALQAPADQLSKNTAYVPASIYHQIPYGASLVAGSPAWATAGQPIAFRLDDGRLWPVSCMDIINVNGSRVTSVSATQFAQTPKGPALYCVR
jgi:hypothetical protein